MPSLRIPVLAALTAVGLAVPATASADVYVQAGPDVVFGGASGQVEVTGSPTTMTFEALDGTANLPDGEPPVNAADCRQVTPSKVTCTPQGNGRFVNVSMILGEGDDVFDASGLAGVGINVEGTAGADRITGGSGADFLRGGTGADELNGGGGNDLLDLRYEFKPRVADVDRTTTTCGAGDRDFVAPDLEDPLPAPAAGCEVVAPMFSGTPAIPGTPVVGSVSSVTGIALRGTQAPVKYAWYSCVPAECSGVLSTAPTFTPRESDIGRRLSVVLSAEVVGGPAASGYGESRTVQSALVTRRAIVGTSPPFAPGPTPVADTKAPTITVPKSLKLRKGVATFGFGKPSEGAIGSLTLKAKGVSVVKRFTAKAGKRLTVRVKLGKAARKKAKRKAGLRVKATLKLRDAAGNQRTSTFRVKLKS